MKNKIMILLLCSICLLIVLPTYAQNIRRQAKTEKVAEIKNRQLIVLLKSEDPEIARKLNGTELQEYRASIRELNEHLQFVLKEYWTFNEKIHFVTYGQVPYLDHENHKYAIMSLDLINIRLSNQITRKPANSTVRLHIGFPEAYDPLRPVFYQDIAGWHTKESVPKVNRMGLTAATFMIQNHLEARLEGKTRRNGLFFEEVLEHPGVLETKVLLIDTIFIDKKLKEVDIPKYYPFPFKISNQEEIETAQINRDSRYAYVYLFPTVEAANIYYHCIMDAETGKVISYSMLYGFHKNNLVDKKHLKKYARFSDYYNRKEKGL